MRLFIALNFDAETRARWWAAALPLRAAAPDARWTGESQLHLTLAFLGAQPESVIAPLGVALDDAARHVPRVLELLVGGVGAFPSMRRPRVLWLGVAPAAPLSSLAARVDRACGALGIPLDARDFHAHITLARLGNGVSHAAVRAIGHAAGETSTGLPASTRSVDLMVSAPSREGPRYEILHAAGFGDSTSSP